MKNSTFVLSLIASVVLAGSAFADQTAASAPAAAPAVAPAAAPAAPAKKEGGRKHRKGLKGSKKAATTSTEKVGK